MTHRIRGKMVVHEGDLSRRPARCSLAVGGLLIGETGAGVCVSGGKGSAFRGKQAEDTYSTDGVSLFHVRGSAKQGNASRRRD